MSDAEARDDDVDEGDEKDDDDNDVVEDVGRSLVGLLVDVQAANDEEEDADNNLRDRFRVRKCEKKIAVFCENGKVVVDKNSDFFRFSNTENERLHGFSVLTFIYFP